ncbi:MAG: bifunctional demethylmenaquinone methyltransferase/2-methoxy-6-polyprenyl-1,4-benzoquinol methylase UbiE [Blastocatellia bacterium AA13]|nr:MAG: bifunctional demethylmenaquinone methyltransferase/2-methoxy-6-polyprenyl-1,4-benzoquinol methylase UbiE [Blastocatellia bacterium AA13]
MASEQASGHLNQISKSDAVRTMFAQIAPRYDFLNHALSLNVDRRWRRRLVRSLATVLERPGARVLDLCCGTADLSIELAHNAETWGVDFCHPMLKLGVRKVRDSRSNVVLIEGDALKTPFPDASFDAVSIAFGLRNLESVREGLIEMLRLIKPGGKVAVLEFSKPIVPVFRNFYGWYFNRVLPGIGRLISGSKTAYRYLPDSVKAFPDQEALAAIMTEVGFSEVTYYNLFYGVAAVHLAEKRTPERRR